MKNKKKFKGIKPLGWMRTALKDVRINSKKLLPEWIHNQINGNKT